MRVFVRTAAVPLAAALVFVGCSHKTEQPPKPKVGSWGVDMTQMDTSVRPGNDFFAYAVGSWVKNAKIPADKVCAGVNLDIQNQLNADLRAIVEGAAAKHAPAGDIAQQIGDLFASYMDEATLNKNGVEPVRPLLASIDAVNDRVALNGVLVSFNGKTRVDDPFPVSVDIDPNNPTRYLPNIWQGGLSLGDRGYYVNTDPESVELRNKFVAHVARLLGLAGYTDSQQQAERLLALETKLAQVQPPREDARNVDKTNNIMPRADVEQLGQGAPLHDMFEALKLPANIDFRVGMPDVLRQTAQLFATEPLDSWQAYMRYQVLDAYGGDLSTPFADELFDFYGRTMGGAEERAPRVERGVTRVSNGLGDPVGELYVGAHFSQQTRDKARALVENLRKAYSQRIDAASWMAPETKKEAQAKLAALVAKIGYPDHWKFYASVKISAADLIGNDNALAVWSWNDDVSKLPKPIDRTEWDMTPQTNNAYYSPRLNDIVFPAAILQPPNFDPAADPAANYGAIGATIGHEMSHAFDDQGRKSDGTGMQRDWWTPPTPNATCGSRTSSSRSSTGTSRCRATTSTGRSRSGRTPPTWPGCASPTTPTSCHSAARRPRRSTASPVTSGSSWPSRRAGGRSAVRRANETNCCRTCTAPRSSGSTESSATWTSGTRRSTSSPATLCTSSPRTASGSGDPLSAPWNDLAHPGTT